MPSACCSRKPSALPQICSSVATSRFGVTFGRPPPRSGSGGHCLARSRASDLANSSTCFPETELNIAMGTVALCCVVTRAVNSVAPRSAVGSLARPVLRDLLASLVRRAWRATGARRPDGRAPQAPGTLRELFESLLWSERYEQARALAEDALARDPASYEAHLLVGRAHQK